MKDLVSDCFGTMMTVGHQVMFAKGAGTKCIFTQGRIDTIGSKYIHIAEVNKDNELVRDDNDEIIIHKRSALGVIRVFTEQEHKENKDDKEKQEAEVHEESTEDTI